MATPIDDDPSTWMRRETLRLTRLIKTPLWQQWADLRGRRFAIEIRLRRPDPIAPVLLATDAGLVLTQYPTGEMGLDIGDNVAMKTLTVDEAVKLGQRFNGTAQGKSTPVHQAKWRDHFTEELLRIDARLAEYSARMNSYK